MESHKLAFKLFFDPASSAPGPGEFVPVFHSWIQQHSVPDHLLIDVADYSHVPEGPQTVLVSHEAIFAIDYAEARPGLQYFRKQPIVGAESFAERLRKVFRIELESCAKLEEDPRLKGRVRFYGPGDVVIGEFGPHEGIVTPRGSQYWFEKVGEGDLEILQMAAFEKGVKVERVDHEAVKLDINSVKHARAAR